MKIKAALSANAQAPFEIAEVELDEPRRDEVLVEIRAVGVCHSDLTMKAVWPRGDLPDRPRSRGCRSRRRRRRRGERRPRRGPRGARAIAAAARAPNAQASHRPYCHNFRSHNGTGTRVDGSMTMRRNGSAVYGSYFGQSSFASHAIAYESNVVVVDDAIDLTIAAPLGCGVQTGAGTVLGVLKPRKEASLVVFGAGAVGLSALMAASACGVQTIIAVDPVESRRRLARELGANTTIDPTSDAVVDAIRELTGAGATHAIDTSAYGAVINQAIEALAPRGTLALLGIGIPDFAMDVRSVISGGKTIRGVIEGDAVPQTLIPRLIALHRDGRLPVEKLIRTYGFEQIDAAFADAADGSTIKPVLIL